MFGFSLAELLVVFVVALIFIKPEDLPEIAHFFGKIFYRAKKYFNDLKRQFKEIEKDIGFDELKQELNRGIAEEKAKLEDLEDDVTIIVDIYGNEHQVKNIHDVRPDISKEERDAEIKRLNEENAKAKASLN